MAERGRVDVDNAASTAIRAGSVGVILGAAMIAIVSALYAASPVARPCRW